MVLSGIVLIGNQLLLDIFLYFEVVFVMVMLIVIQCGVQDNGSMQNDVIIFVMFGLVNVYVGKLLSDVMNNMQQSWLVFIVGGQVVFVVNVNFLGILVVILNLQLFVSLFVVLMLLLLYVFSVDLVFFIGQQVGMIWFIVDLLMIGLGNVISSLFGLINLQISDMLLGILFGIDLGVLFNGLMLFLSLVLVLLFDMLDIQLVSLLLQLLGIELGLVDVRLMLVYCDVGVQLVY